MREIRQSGSEGWEAKAFPTPIGIKELVPRLRWDDVWMPALVPSRHLQVVRVCAVVTA